MPETFRAAIDAAFTPATVLWGSLAALVVLYLGRRWFVRPAVAAMMLLASLAALAVSLCDATFRSVALAPDNIAVLATLILFGFFTWLSAVQAVENDRRAAEGQPPAEKGDARRVFTWPDLVLSELVCAMAVLALLTVWSVAVPAPLEAPANPALTPNPSKAPWYFLGLQELLFYSDSWLAGVVVPSLAIVGLMALPYLDFNPAGSGYFTILERRFAYVVFQFGFWQLGLLLILIGTFCRGPNWEFFGPFEPRQPHGVAATQCVNLSTWFWSDLLGREIPTAPAAAGVARTLWAAWREIAGLGLCLAYFLGFPLLLWRTAMYGFRERMGWPRFILFTALLLLMLAIPLKMLLQTTFHLRAVVALPECRVNF